MIANGNWGACQWTISESGILTIYEGVSDGISSEEMSPWYDYSSSIKKVCFSGDVSLVEGASLACMFKDCTNLVEVDLDKLNTAGVTSMTSMFEGCTSLEEVDLTSVDFANVNSISGMFNSCESLRKVSLDGIDTGKVSNMIGMFMNCKSLEEVDLSSMNTSGVLDMSWLFCGCENLKRADLSSLDMSHVVDMSCMFLSCTSLEEVILGDIDTSTVMDMSRMFMYCRNLRCLDASHIDNTRTEQAEDMFVGCDKLCSLGTGEKFSLLGSGNAPIILPESGISDDEMISDWRKASDGTYYKPGTRFTIKYESKVADWEIADEACTAAETIVVALPQETTSGDMLFKEWNTRADGSGKSLSPGQQIKVYSDMRLYAIWAGNPKVTKECEIPELIHGQTPFWEKPDADPMGADITGFEPQIKRPGSDEWTSLSDGEELATEDDGALVRYRISNFVGSTYSEPVKLTVEKASYDMSNVRWVVPEDLSYNGEEKRVYLEGLPEGVEATYTGECAVEVGDYTATATYIYDDVHYYRPEEIEPLQWSIGRGHYDMGSINWTYMEAFVYDGTEKKVRLEGLPEGTRPYYDGADGVDAGTYVATAGLEYDVDRYDRPDGISPCRWEIRKSDHDMSGISWESEPFVYDGGEKKVELTGIPVGVTAQYTGNLATAAGQYTARAAFVVDDPKNYTIPEPVSFSWEIKKADHDISEMKWTCDQFVYDGEAKEIHVEGIPEGVDVSYEGNTGKLAGAYLARAEFLVQDLNNYNPIDPWTSPWQISKATYDMSRASWKYSSPYVYNGMEKAVALNGLPEGVSPVYENERAVDAGEYTAKATLLYDDVNYEKPEVETCTWQIKKATPIASGITWEYDGPFTYDGEAHEVRLANVPEEFTVEYENNVATNAGRYVAVAHLASVDQVNFKDPEPMELPWQIDRAVFQLDDVRWNTKEIKTYDGSDKTVEITNLPAGLRAVYTDNEATDAGNYVAKARFEVEDTVNFLPPDPVQAEWNIERSLLDISSIRWSNVTEFTYDGTEKSISLIGVPEDVEVIYDSASATDAGEYFARAELIPPEDSNFRNTKILSQRWQIHKASLELGDAYWDYDGPLTYDGEEKFVRIGSLPPSLRPMYEGDKHTKAGEYTATVKLIPVYQNNYKAPEFEPLTWKIERANVDVSDAVWTDCSGFRYDGEPKSIVIENLPEPLEAEYEGNEAVDAGQYVATANFTVKDERNYIAPGPIKQSWSIQKGDVDVSAMHWEEERTFDYDGEPKRLLLADVPEGVLINYQGNEATEAGQYMASAVLEHTDTKNYNDPTIDPVPWEITRAELDVSGISWVSAERLVYDGNIKVVGLTGLPDDVTVEYENNTATEAGTYHASAVLSTDSKNYTAPPIRGCTWTISKAPIDIDGISWDYREDLVYDGYEKSVRLVGLPSSMKAEYSGNEAIEAGEYTAQVRLIPEDPLNYEAPEIPALNWKISKSDYDLTEVRWVPDNAQVYDGTAKEVVLEGLPDGLEPIYDGNIAVEAGTYRASARFLYDEDNYNKPFGMEIDWVIEKAPFDLSGVVWDYQGPIKASRKMRTVELVSEGGTSTGGFFKRKTQGNILGLPEGSRVRYEGNSAKDAGVYEAKAYIEIPEQPNHEVKGPITLTWEIIDG